MTNREVRTWYKSQVARIPQLNQEWLRRGDSTEQRARQAWRIRRDARLKARGMMEDPKEVELLEQRDMSIYGNRQGPSFEQLFESYKREGRSDDQIYELIIVGAATTNRQVDGTT